MRGIFSEVQTYLYNHLYPLVCTMVGAVVLVFLPFDISVPQIIIIAAGIFCGYLFADHILHRVGMDVFFIPVIFSTVLAIAVDYLSGTDPITRRGTVELILAIVLVVFIGQIGALFLLKVYDRILGKSKTVERN